MFIASRNTNIVYTYVLYVYIFVICIRRGGGDLAKAAKKITKFRAKAFSNFVENANEPELQQNRYILTLTRLNYRLAGNQWGLNRKQVSQVGCGYTIRLNKTHYIDHLVCLYCAFEFKQKGLHYVVRRGPPCTECNYYQTEYPWRCGKRYKHLCVGKHYTRVSKDIPTIVHTFGGFFRIELLTMS